MWRLEHWIQSTEAKLSVQPIVPPSKIEQLEDVIQEHRVSIRKKNIKQKNEQYLLLKKIYTILIVSTFSGTSFILRQPSQHRAIAQCNRPSLG